MYNFNSSSRSASVDEKEVVKFPGASPGNKGPGLALGLIPFIDKSSCFIHYPENLIRKICGIFYD
jgi:hypothetical protein